MSNGKFQFFKILIFSVFAATSAQAEMGIPVQLRLKSPGGTYPTESGVAIKLQVMSPSGGCILREEIFSNQTITDGNISLVLGSGAVGTYDPGISLNSVYDNSRSKTGLTCVNASNVIIGTGQTYNPTSIDQRIIRFTATVTGSPIVVDFNMKSIPYAIQAESVGGKLAADIIVNNATSQLNQTNLNNLLLDATRLSNLLDVAQNGNAQSADSATNFTGSLVGDVTGTQGATVVGRLRGVNISATAPTSGQILVYDGSQYAPMNQGTAAVTSVAGRTGAVSLTTVDIGGLGTAATQSTGTASGNVVQLDSAGKLPTSTLPNNLLTTSSTLAGDVSGNLSANTVDAVGGKTSAQVSQSVDDTLAAVSSATAGTIVKRDGSGNASLNTVTSLNNSTQNIYLYNVSNSNSVRVRAPVTFSDYILTLPTTDGTANQVLQTDGAGNLDWLTIPTTGVQSVSATSPLVATGTTNVSLSINVGTTSGTVAAGDDTRIANALQPSTIFSGDVSGTYNTLALVNSGVAASTYSKVTVDAKGRVTSGSSINSFDVTGALGYTPANVASAGTVTNVSSVNPYLSIANNSTTPSLTINVGTASGTLAAGNDTRITNALQFSTLFSGDVSGTYNTLVLANSGVAASTYSKVTVDAKGRVTSGSSINSSDVITALGYSPANAASAGTVTNVSSGNSYTTVTNNTTAPVVTVNVGTTANTLAAGDDTRIANALQFSTLFSGDVSGTYNTLVLANSGVAASTYSKVTVDAKGRVTSGSSINASDVTTALGYSPANAASAGTVTNVSSANAYINVASGTSTPSISLNVGTVSNTVAAGNDSRIVGALQQTTFDAYVAPASCSAGQTMYWNSVGGNFQCQNILISGDVSGTATATTVSKILGTTVSVTALAANNILQYNGSVYVNKNIPTCLAGEFITYNGTSWTCEGVSGASGGTVTNVSSGNSYTTITNNTTAPVVTVNVGTTANTVAAGNDTRIANALQTSTTFAGDVSGTYNTLVLANSGVAASTYSKVTVDAKGRVTSGSSINSSDVSSALGYTPANAASAGTVTNVSSVNPYLSIANNSTTPSLTINVGTASGTLAAGNDSRITNALQFSTLFSGDVSGTYNSIVLANSGVAASTYSKVTVDAKGRVTSGSSINSSDVTTALGYTPANAASAGATTLAGDVTGTAASNVVSLVGGKTSAQVSQSVSDTLSATSLNTINTIVKRNGTGGFNASSGVFESNVQVKDGAAGGAVTLQTPVGFTSYALTFPINDGSPNQVLQTDGSGILSWVTGAAGTVTNVSSANTYLTVTSSATTPVITANVGTTSGTLAAGDDSRIANALQTSTLFAGDVSGTYNTLVLANSGVAASTYSKVTVDAKGRVTSGSSINSSDVTTALGYSPANVASAGTVTNVSSGNSYTTITNNTTAPVVTVNVGTTANTVAAGDDTRITNALQFSTLFSGDVSGTYNSIVLSNSGVAASTYSKVTVDAKGRVTSGSSINSSDVSSALGYTPANAASAGTVTNVSSVNPYLSIANNSTTPSLTINVGTASGTLAAGNDSRITNALQFSTLFAGDVSGTYNSIVLANSGVAASTYSKVTVDAKGRVTSGSSINSSDISSALGYTPANVVSAGTVTNVSSGNSYTTITNNTTVPVVTVNVGTTANTLAAGNDSRITNALQFSTLFSGDVSGTYNSLVLANSGVAASTYSKVTVDAKGRVTSGSSINSSDVTTALGYTPANAASAGATTLAGDVTGTAASNVVSLVGGKTSAQVSQSVSDTIAATSLNTINTIVKRNGTGGFNASSGVFESNVQVKDGAAGGAVTLQTPVGFTSYALTFPINDGSPNQVLQTDGSGILSWVAAGVGSVTNVSSANTYLTVTSSATTPVLTLNVGTASGTVAAGDDTRIANALQTSTLFAGDVSGTYNTLVLANSGVAASTYSKVTVDAKGRVTSGTSLVATDIPNLETTKITSGTFSVARGGTGLSTLGTANQILGINAAATGLEYKTITAGANITVSNTAGVLTISSSNPGGTVTNVSSANPYITVTNGTSTPVITANVGTASGTLAAGDDIRIANALQTTTVFAGDISGTASAVTVDRIRGTNVLISALANNNILQYNGTDFVNKAIPTCSVGQYLFYNGTAWSCVTDGGGTVTNVTSGNSYTTITNGASIPVVTVNVGTVSNTVAAGDDSRIVGALQQTTFNGYVAPASCNANQTMYWNSVASTFACQDVLVAGDVTGTVSTTVVTKIQGVAVSSAAPVAGQALVYNGTQWVPKTGFPQFAKLTADFTNTGGATLADVTGLSFPVTSGKTYKFTFYIVYSTSNTARGLRATLTTPTFTTFSARAEMPTNVADGTDNRYTGQITSSGDVVVAGSTPAGNNIALIEGVILVTADGNVQLQAAQSAGGTSTIRTGSSVEFTELP